MKMSDIDIKSGYSNLSHEVENSRMEIDLANEQILALHEKLASATSDRDAYWVKCQRLGDQLEQIHMFMDALPYPIQRLGANENLLEPLTRLSAWIANRVREAVQK